MQLHKFSLLFCGIIAVLQLQAQAIPQPTRAVTQSTYSSTSPLANERRETFFRLPDGRNDHILIEVWDPATSSFQLRTAQFYAYDANKNVAAIYGNTWDAVNGYTETNRYLREYNADNLITLDSSSRLDAATGIWLPDNVARYAYSPSKKETLRSNTGYSQAGTVYRNRVITSYDALDRVEWVLFEQFDDNQQAWLNAQRNDNFYIGNTNQLDSVYTYAAVFGSGLLERNSRQIYSYPSALVTQWLTENWIDNSWTLGNRATSTKNNNDQVISILFEEFDQNQQQFTPYGGYELDFNPDKSIIQFRFYTSDFNTDQYYQTLQIDFDYGIYTDAPAPAVLDAEVTIMPNPVVNTAQIQLRGNAADQMAHYALTDVQGRVVATGQITGGNAQLSLSGQPSGMYLLRIEQVGAMKVVPVLKR